MGTTVQPSGVLAFNSTKNYTIAGSGSIAGVTSVSISGAGSLTLSNKNTYTGGTVVNSGQLNINNGGDGGANSAIGTGSLTLMLGSRLDNTSGSAVTLLANNPVFWNDDFSFVGFSSLDLGQGQVTLGSVNVILTVVSNSLTVNNPVTDNGQNYGLTKAGNGTLTLSSYNYFSGGMTLSAGKLNINNDVAVGTGQFSVNGGTIDNTSGHDLILSFPSRMVWNGDFTFQGTTNLDLGGATVQIGAPNINLTVVSNTLTTEGSSQGGDRQVTKLGNGVWNITGGANNASLGIAVNTGTVNFNKSLGAYVLNFNALTVNTNGKVVFLGSTGMQIASGGAPVTLAGGTIDLNGDSEPYISRESLTSQANPSDKANISRLVFGSPFVPWPGSDGGAAGLSATSR